MGGINVDVICIFLVFKNTFISIFIYLVLCEKAALAVVYIPKLPYIGVH